MNSPLTAFPCRTVSLPILTETTQGRIPQKSININPVAIVTVKMIRTVAFCLTALITGPVVAVAALDFPVDRTGTEAVYLATNPNFNENVPKGVQVCVGVLADYKEVSGPNPDLNAPQKSEKPTNAITLSFAVENKLPPGEYSLWTHFLQGMDALQTFHIVAGDQAKPFQDEFSFIQAAKSRKPVWREAPGRFTLYPGEKNVTIKVVGVGNQKQMIGGFFLVRVGKLPTAMTEEGGKLRRAAYGRYNGVGAAARLLVLEGDDPVRANPVFNALVANPQLAESISLERISSDRGATIAANLDMKTFPAMLLIAPNDIVLREWVGPLDQRKLDQILADIARAGALTPVVHSPQSRVTQLDSRPLMDGRPAVWLFSSPSSGQAGQTLWGLGYEENLRPNPRDPFIEEDFDPVCTKSWEPVAMNTDHRYCYGPLERNYLWAQGASYGSLYIEAESDVDVQLHLNHTGVRAYAWLDGTAIPASSDAGKQAETGNHSGRGEIIVADKNDQGGVMQVLRSKSAGPLVVPMKLHKGWNRILLKFVLQQSKGEIFDFSTRFTQADGIPATTLRTMVTDPTPSLISRQAANAFIPMVYTGSPFNLVYSTDALSLSVDIGSVGYSGVVKTPYYTIQGALEMQICDYDGKEVAKQTKEFALPGVMTFDFKAGLPRGYYSTRLRLLDRNGNLVTTYPPDGFSVIGGTASQETRKDRKKIAVTYYFMARLHKTLYFPYMKRMGIYRNIGGHNARLSDFYEEAAAQGLFLSADLWSYRDPKYIDDYVKETAQCVDSYKSFNEIDIRPDVRGTPEQWVAKAKLEFETVKKYAPKALLVGGSLVRPGSDDWFPKCLKLGLQNYQDVWDVHCYPKVPPVLEAHIGNGAGESELGVLKVMKELGYTNTKPFWLGETGARSSHGLDGRRWQADTVAKMIAWALSRKDVQQIGFLIPWNYDREKGKLNDIDAGHMPAAAAFYTASALMDGFSYTRLPLGKLTQAAQFGPTTMIWILDAKSEKLQVKPVGKGPFVQVDVVGRVKQLETNEQGLVSVEASDHPIYVLSRTVYDELTRF